MARYRAFAFGKPVAPWQATYELAAQSAIETDNAHREPRSGRVYLSPGVEIKEAAGDVPLTGDLPLWAEALAIVRSKRHRAISFAEDEVARHAADIPTQARWVLIRRRIVQIMEAAAKDARR